MHIHRLNPDASAPSETTSSLTSDSLRLSKFLESSGAALLTLLEEEAERNAGQDLQGQEQKDVEFSEKVGFHGF